MDNAKKVVFEYALIQRINRKLSGDAKQLQAARSFQVETSVGHYFIVNLKRNSITRQHVQLEGLGREMGVLADCEALIFGSRYRYRYRPAQIMRQPMNWI